MIDRQAVLDTLDVERFYGQRLGDLQRDGGQRLKALCPFKAETKPSFTIYRRDKGFKCFSCGASGSPFDLVMRLENCEFAEALQRVAREVGLDSGEEKAAGRLVRVHTWYDAEANPVFRKKRLEPKEFFIEVPDGNGGWRPRDSERDGPLPLMLYGEELLAACPEEAVWFTEGERDADTARGLGLLGVTSGGTSSWHRELAEKLRGRIVCIVPHADDAGERFAQQVARDLHSVAKVVKIVRLAEVTQ
jgi:hypothetical protein